MLGGGGDHNTVKPALTYPAPRLSSVGGGGGEILHFGCALIRSHVEFASSAIENVLISNFHLSG